MWNTGRILFTIGIFFLVLGLVFMLVSKLHIPFLGKLPGDILIQKKNFTFFFPVTSCLVVSLFFSLALWLFFRK